MSKQMSIGKAVAIFKNINSDEYSVEEKGTAIYMVMKMPTHNGITKEQIFEVLKWLFNQQFEVERGGVDEEL